MTIILNTDAEAACCLRALANAGRFYSVRRNHLGQYEITTRD